MLNNKKLKGVLHSNDFFLGGGWGIQYMYRIRLELGTQVHNQDYYTNSDIRLLVISPLNTFPVEVDGCTDDWPLGLGTQTGLRQLVTFNSTVQEQRQTLQLLKEH